MSYGVGIIGTGMIARFHARAINEAEGGEVVASLSRAHERAAAFAGEYGGNAYDEIDAFLKDPAVQVVSICTPSGAHMEPALRAMEAGKHVMVEKPLEISLERCDRMVDAAQRNGVRLGCIFQSRFGEGAKTVKHAVDAGRFGSVAFGDAYVKWWRPQSYYDEGGWKGTAALDGGGALLNQAIHAVDLLQWFMGPVTEVSARTGILGHDDIEVEDTAAALCCFESGAFGVIQATTSIYPGFDKRIEIGGSGGSVTLAEDAITVWRFAEEHPQDEEVRTRFAPSDGGSGASDPAAISHDGHARQFEDFFGAIRDGREPVVNGEEARKSVEIILAVYESARREERLTLPLQTSA